MAITFTNMYDDMSESFEKRMYETLHAQSLAIAAALALAAKNSAPTPETSLMHQNLRVRAADRRHRIHPANENDHAFAIQHLNNIFNEAQRILDTKLDFESAPATQISKPARAAREKKLA